MTHFPFTSPTRFLFRKRKTPLAIVDKTKQTKTKRKIKKIECPFFWLYCHRSFVRSFHLSFACWRSLVWTRFIQIITNFRVPIKNVNFFLFFSILFYSSSLVLILLSPGSWTLLLLLLLPGIDGWMDWWLDERRTNFASYDPTLNISLSVSFTLFPFIILLLFEQNNNKIKMDE